ncbi:MAG: homocysteine S-methyltransferase family protein [Desulfobacteraceae bacterium]|jgi:5-methyltetrahydrofolate--homocysteine methyltransferase
MNLSDFIIEKEVVLIDGAIGTQLETHGSVMGGQSNLTTPDIVLDIHKDYSKTGCHILTANTLTMNRVFLERHGLDIDVRAVNLKGVELVKKAAGQDKFVLGDISSTGKLLEPYGPVSETEAFDSFCEQASILEEGGVNGFIIETMIHLAEALCALKACRKVSNLPVLTAMSFSTPGNGGRTVMGNSAEECTKALSEGGASSVGANCGNVDPFEMAEIISVISASTALPVIAMPNAGKPEMVEDRLMFNMSPSDYVKGIKECIKAGAKIVGGCCGTTPEHISVLAESLGLK